MLLRQEIYREYRITVDYTKSKPRVSVCPMRPDLRILFQHSFVPIRSAFEEARYHVDRVLASGTTSPSQENK
jgi:hypothetical protein